MLNHKSAKKNFQRAGNSYIGEPASKCEYDVNLSTGQHRRAGVGGLTGKRDVFYHRLIQATFCRSFVERSQKILPVEGVGGPLQIFKQECSHLSIIVSFRFVS